jgi:transmembrane sensor
MTDYSRYLELAEKWKNGTISMEEQHELDTWYNANQDKPVEIPDYIAASETSHEQRLLRNIRAKITQEDAPVKYIQLKKWITAAAIILIISSIALYFTAIKSETPQPITSLETIIPGTERATLTLSNGNKIELNNQPEIQDGNNKIINKNSSLVYTQNATLAFNTMTTPIGSTYTVQLSDGTKVWLNAASSITFPTIFTGDKRTVILKGEAYFEVAKNTKQSFIVEANNNNIQVIGTHFNVNAYSNEPFMQTTLLEGAVKVNNTVLQPGEAWMGGKIKKVNTEAAVAWKNGLFHFDEANLETVMRQLQRWYNIEVKFEGNVPEETFQGELKRNLNLAQIMKLLSYMNINYRLEKGRNLIVSEK